MAHLVGTYKLESEENSKEFLKSLGLNDEQAQKVLDTSETTVIKSIDENSITVEFTGKDVTYPVNKELEQTLPDGVKIWTTTTFADDAVKFMTKLSADGKQFTERIFKLVDGVLVITSTNAQGIKSVRKFKRV